MGLEKNFVVKKGIEVATDLIFADTPTNRVGVGTTVPTRKLDVNGDFQAVGDARVTGITTVDGKLDIGVAGTAFRVATGTKKVGINTQLDASLFDFEVVGDVGFSTNLKVGGITTSTMAHVVGLTSTMDLHVLGLGTITDARVNAGFVTVSYTDTDDLLVSIAGTFARVDINSGDIDVQTIDVGVCTVSRVDINSGDVDINTLEVVGVSTIVNSFIDRNTVGIETVTGILHVTGTSDFDDDVLFDGANDILFDQSESKFQFKDNAQATFGDNNDLKIYHDGSDSYISEAGVGNLILRGSADIRFMHPVNGDTYAIMNANDSVELYYDNLKKLETLGTGVTVTGRTYSSNFSLPDNGKYYAGNQDDLQIYHSGADAYIDNNTRHIYIRSNVDGDDNGNIYLQAKSGENGVTVNDDGSVQLYFDNSLKLSTDNEGVNITNVLDVSTQLNTATLNVSSGSTFVGNVRLEANLDLQDNDKILIGNDDDLEIYHNGTNSYIDENGSGFLFVRTNEFQVRKAGSTEKMITATADNSVELYYDSIKRLQTLGTGVTVTGLTQSSDFSVPDNGRYYAGNDNDFTFFHDGTNSILNNNTGDLYLRNGSSNSNQIYIQALQGNTNATFMPDGRTITTRLETSNLTVSSGSTFTGNVRLEADLDLQDNDKILIGNDDDLKIYHDSSNSYIDDTGTGSLFVRSNEFQVRKNGSTEVMIAATADNSVDLYFNNSNKLQTTNVGVNVIGTIESDGVRVNDNDTISAGTDQDLSIYHNGTNAIIDNNTGSIYIRSNKDGDDGGNIYLQAKSGENGIVVNDDSSVALYHDGNKKFETKTTGADVTGTLTTDDLDVSGTVTAGIITAVSGMTVTGDLFAGSFRGDGSLLTGIDTSGNFSGKTVIAENLYIPVGIATVGNVVLNNPSGRVNATSVEASNATFTGNVISGKGSGGVALTVNDGQGNANVTFNHTNGVPEQNGNSARISHNSDSTSDPVLIFELASGVTANTNVNSIPKLTIGESAITAESGVVFTGNGSGLTNVDAETIDSLNSSDFIRSNADDNVTGHTEWQDNKQVRFGNDADFTINHNGTANILQSINGSISLQVPEGKEIQLSQGGTFEHGVKMIAGGEVQLYHNGSEKLNTSSSGVSVTGTLVATTFSGSGASLTSIPNGALNNSTISGIALGSNLATLTRGSYLTGSNYNGSTARTWAVDATSGNTASKVVARDGSGNFSAGTITASLSGTATNATNFNVAADNSTNATHYITFTGGATGNQRPNSDTGLTWNPSTNTLTAANFDGNATTATNATNAGTVDGLNASSFIRSDADDNVSGHTEWQDSKEIRLGNGADFRMTFNGADTIFRNYAHANGDIIFQGENSDGNNQNILKMKTDGTRTYNALYENNAERFRTNSTGVSVTGTLDATTSVTTPTVTATGTVQGNILKSTVASGTAPFIVASSTKVTNLNADKLDNLTSASFLRADADDTFTGTLSGVSDTVNPVIQIKGTGPNIIRFLDNTSITLGIDLVYRATPHTLGFEKSTDGTTLWETDCDTGVTNFSFTPTVSGNTVWHAGNDGSGSGLDADKLDNLNSGQFLRSDANDTASGELTFNGRVNIRGNIDLSDGENLDFGSSDDVRISYNSNNWLYTNFRTGNGIVFQDNGVDTTILEDSGIFRPQVNNTGSLGTSSKKWNNVYATTFTGSLSGTATNAGKLDNLDSTQFLRSDADDTMTGALTIDVDNKSAGALRINANQTNPNNDFYFAQEIVSTLSGTTATTADREQGGIYMDINSTATGGDTGNEHRAYGIYIDLDSTGDADNVYGIYSDATATPTTGTTSEVAGVFGRAEDNGGAGSVSNLTGVRGETYSDNSTSDVNNMYGGHFRSVCASDTGNIGAAHGVYAEIEIPDGTGDHFGDSYVFRAVYDDNDGVAQTNNTYLFHGDYTGTKPTNAYGVYIVDNVQSYFGGNVTSNAIVQGITLKSTVATGTAPLTVASTTKVTNLNADLLDGISSASFLRSDATDASSGRIQFTSGNNKSANVSTGSLGAIEVYQATVNKDAFMAFHIANDYAGYFGLDGATNDLFWGGWSVGATKHKIWHAGNDGSGSGLDADKLDNIQASSFLRSDANDTASGELTFNGRVNIRGHIDLSDGENLDFGSSDDVRISYSSNNWLYTNFRTGAGIIFQDNGSNVVRLEDSGIFRPETTNTGQIGSTGQYWKNGYFQNIDVSSTLNVRGAIDLADNDILRFGTGDDVEFFTNGSHMYTDLNSGIGNWYIRDGTTTRFTFDDAGHFTATGNINSNSDIRLKDNIETLEGSLDKVKQLRGVEYDRIDSDEKFHQLGVIAQEIEKVYPDMVDEGEDGMKTVSYQQLIPVLIEAVKELSQEVDNLKSKINN